jgi:midasin
MSGNLKNRLKSMKVNKQVIDRLSRIARLDGRQLKDATIRDAIAAYVDMIRGWISDAASDQNDHIILVRRNPWWLAFGMWYPSLTCVEQFQNAVVAALSFCGVGVDLLESPLLDQATVNAYCVAGSLMSRDITKFAANVESPVLPRLHDHLASANINLKSGTAHASLALYRTLQAPSPETVQQLEALVTFEATVDDFDVAMRDSPLFLTQAADLRGALLQSLSLTNLAPDFQSLADKIKALLPKSRMPENAKDTVPLFKDTFEILCQHFARLAFQSTQFPETTLVAKVEILAGRSTLASVGRYVAADTPMPAWQSFKLLALSSHNAGDVIAATGSDASSLSSISTSLMRSLSEVDHVTLRNLSLLEVESGVIGQCIASKADLLGVSEVRALDICLRSLVTGVLRSLHTAEAHSALEDVADRLLKMVEANLPFERLPLSSFNLNGTIQRALENVMVAVEYLCKIGQTAYDPRSASAWRAFAVSCLQFYIPSFRLDPRQVFAISRTSFEYHKDELRSTHAALRSFTTSWTGQSESLRGRQVEGQLKEIGSGPSIPKGCRPEISEFAQLSSELDALMRILTPLAELQTDDSYSMALTEEVCTNLSVIRERLMRRYRAYADFVSPIIGCIDCLQVSKHMANKTKPDTLHHDQSASLAEITPLAGAELADWTSDVQMTLAVAACRSQEERLYWLAVQGVRSSFVPEGALSSSLLVEVENVFCGLYEIWKNQLTRDQRLAAANSSIYKYRGEDDSQDDPTPEDLQSMFPLFDGEHKVQDQGIDLPNKAQDIVVQVARLYRAFYSGGIERPKALIELQLSFAQLASNRNLTKNESSTAPGLICALEELRGKLDGQKASKQQQNIYLDANISECKKLLQLISKVRTRFNVIHTAWPDHATPIDVLRACSDIEDLSHSQPLASFIPPVEKLHATVGEWQKVASKEFSALELLDSLTDIVVSWRQLELSTWTGLFDREDYNCQRDAASWWYVAYESVIRASEDLGNDREYQQFAQQLAETISHFLAQCGLGEFTSRLNVLRDFLADLTIRSQKHACYTVIRDCLSGLIRFHAYFEPAVKKNLLQKRADLDKQVKNIIQLASWKDRNLETLKTSAKSSHKKLFRLVRKYRKLLCEPVAPYLQGAFPDENLSSNEVNGAQSFVIKLDIGDLGVNPQSRRWHQQAAHLGQLAASHRQGHSIPSATPDRITNGTELVREWLAELQADITGLRKATPNILNEENKPQIQQLKAQKRRLLADVLKDTRTMGFQTNLSEDALSGQKSIHVIFSRTSPLHQVDSHRRKVNFDFYKTLHIMSDVRSAASKHSDDLTPAEVARARILLESMLQGSIQQQIALTECARDVTLLNRTLNHMKTFAHSHRPSARRTKNLDQILIDANSIVEVARASAHCVQAQSVLANKTYTEIIDSIEQEAAMIETIITGLTPHLNLPRNMDDARVRELEGRFCLALQNLSSIVNEGVQAYTELGPTLSCLGRWANQAGVIETQTRDVSSIGAEQWSNTLGHLAEQVHACIEENDRVGSIKAEKPFAKAWLANQRAHLEKKLKALQIPDIAQEITTLMENATMISAEDDSTLAELASLTKLLLPILQAYATTIDSTFRETCDMLSTTCMMAHQLGLHFIQLANDGFCGPAEKSQGKEQSKDVESGTGLGDGEGAEDISKDIADDEDLSELAQEPNTQDQDNPLDAEKDAVDMADEEFEGEMDDGADSQDDETEKDDQSEADLDEEAGKGDELGAEANDEKTWEGDEPETQDKEGENTKGKKSDDIGAAADEDDQDEQMPENGDDALEEPDVEADHEDTAPPSELDQTDAHAKEEQNLELPEDIVMDGDDASIGSIESDLDDDMISENGDELHDDDSATPKAGAEDPEQLEENDGEPEEDVSEDEDSKDEIAESANEGNEESNDEPDDIDSNVAAMESKDTAPPDPTEAPNAADAGQGNDEDQVNKNAATASTTQDPEESEPVDQSMADAGDAEGQEAGQEKQMPGQAEELDRPQTLPFKQLGDALKQWYDQHREIEAAQEDKGTDEANPNQLDTNDQRFQHLPDENEAENDMQALGTASADQSKSFDNDNAIQMDETDDPSNVETPPEKPPAEQGEDIEMPDSSLQPDLNASDSRLDTKAMIGARTQVDMSETDEHRQNDSEDELDDVHDQLTNTHLSTDEDLEGLSIADARKMWAEHEARTRTMAIVLSEHLRLILNPTQATKMRGDFRTGKRLNIKKIIPYIASSYKRDKIWMRRAIPSKRSYQIMLAIDDSESMTERESKNLAFDTLALVAKGMAMLEVGEVCVVGFGEEINVAHDFSIPYTSEAGAEILRQFTFAQSKTDVRKLLQESITIFREARMRATGSASDLWQLQLIISDGECEDHASIRQLVRQAHEERIMVVFIIVDSAARNTADATKQSILDLSRAEFVKDANGEAQLKMTKYLDTFPFQYYLIVRDVLELPGVLAGALRQWFAEVVDAGV